MFEFATDSKYNRITRFLGAQGACGIGPIPQSILLPAGEVVRRSGGLPDALSCACGAALVRVGVSAYRRNGWHHERRFLAVLGPSLSRPIRPKNWNEDCRTTDEQFGAVRAFSEGSKSTSADRERRNRPEADLSADKVPVDASLLERQLISPVTLTDDAEHMGLVNCFAQISCIHISLGRLQTTVPTLSGSGGVVMGLMPALPIPLGGW